MQHVTVRDNVTVAVQLNPLEIRDCLTQRARSPALSEQRQRLWKRHLVIEVGKTNHVAAAAAPIAVEQALAGAEEEARFAISA